MKSSKILSTISLLFIILFGSTVVLADSIDRIVAVVNSNVITESQLDQQITMARQQMPPNSAPLTDAQLRDKVLQHMIDVELQMQIANKMGIKVSDAELDKAITDIGQKNGLSLAQLQNNVQQQGVSYDQYRQEIRTEMTISQVQQRQLAPTVTVTDQQVKDLLLSSGSQILQTAPTSYHIQDILVSLPDSPTTQQVDAAQQQAQMLKTKLESTPNFAKTMPAQAGVQAQDLGWLKPADVPDLFVASVQHMQPGNVAGPIRAPNGFHVIKLVEMHGGTVMQHTSEETHARHILLKPRQFETDDQVRDRLERLRTSIVNGEDFATLATANSQDPGSAGQGGDIGWVGPGVLDPTFEAEMNKLKINEISEPFKSQFGWHIVQVLGRRDVQDSKDFERNQARQYIYQRKFQEALQHWLQSLRTQAYVKIND